MGKSIIIPLVVEERVGRVHPNGMAYWRNFGEWRKEYGKPTPQNLQTFRQKFIDSTKKGGCNEHLGLQTTGNLRIRRQKDNQILAEFSPPMFEII
jgi:hypothetical protein